MIGVIADDVTGASDVAAALSRAGLRTWLALSPEALGVPGSDADAVVVGLKTRSVSPVDAVQMSLRALRALQESGVTRFYFKYCSTFDSTPTGNIGPVVEALAAALGVQTVVTTPAAPIHGRTVRGGELFVDGHLLHETHMAYHPLNPMRDSSLPRLLSPQVSGVVDTLPLAVVHEGVRSVRDAITFKTERGIAHIIADAVECADLAVIAEAIKDSVLAAGSAGLIGAIAERELAKEREFSHPPEGRTAIIAGSCSSRTLEQIARFREAGGRSYRIIASPGQTAEELAREVFAWWEAQPVDASTLIYSSSPAADRDEAFFAAGELYEDAAGIIARGLSERGVRRMLIAGGETSGAVIRELGTTIAVVGAEVAVGAPWIHDTDNDVHLILKSGNFGAENLFVDVALQRSPL